MRMAFVAALVLLVVPRAYGEEASAPAADPAQPEAADRALEGSVVFGPENEFRGLLTLALPGENAPTLNKAGDTFAFKVRREDGGEEVRRIAFGELNALEIVSRDEADPYRWREGRLLPKRGDELAGEFLDLAPARVVVTPASGNPQTFVRAQVRAIRALALWPLKAPLATFQGEGAIDPKTLSGLAQGELAPAFKAKSVNHGVVDLATLRGKSPLLIIFATDEANTDNAPKIERLQQHLAGRARVIVVRRTVPFGIIGETAIRALKLSYPVIWDRDQSIRRQYAIKAEKGNPVVFYTNRDGLIVHVGPSRKGHGSIEHLERKALELWPPEAAAPPADAPPTSPPSAGADAGH